MPAIPINYLAIDLGVVLRKEHNLKIEAVSRISWGSGDTNEIRVASCSVWPNNLKVCQYFQRESALTQRTGNEPERGQ